MKSFFKVVQNLLSTKHLLQIGFLSISLIGISLANAAKEEQKASAKQEKAEEHEEEAAALTNEQLKTAGIGLAQVGPADIRETISLYGTVYANGEKIQRVAARFVGTVRTVNKKVGDTVKEGEVLVTVESNESLKTYSITSAISGVVAERHSNVGEQTTDKTIFVIADLSSVWVDVAIFPRDAAKIRVGQTVKVTNPSNDVTGEGKIISVSALGSSTNQSLTARVLLANAEHEWTPGLFVNADVVLAKKTAALTIRNEALQDHEGKQVVFVRSQKGFAPRPVKVGRTDGEVSEVLGGVKAGETYASKNSFIIKAELGKDGAEHE
ncbi:efflux RND transporter periplasmic adaptor subunit [Shewanella avicenniae]|uniref:Efflux RND transporter periplasmic adaptor subunit n=1 Tax=Shewanella avicenniae TaxID=2814294 RepID=A0ABX7QQP9_9GAMM|nr:efflux RND transporter periplasmic adaptor subunit [Shewanella avicenniae]QSX33794.1 efflux RND transporter periplasmic adaptor subunit [Shewanella avicenniae]